MYQEVRHLGSIIRIAEFYSEVPMQRFLIIVLGLILLSGCDFTVGTPYDDKKDSKTIWNEIFQFS